MITAGCERLGIEVPIIQAPMGGAVGPALAAAVSNAGGLGTLALWGADYRHYVNRFAILALSRLNRSPST